MLPFLVQCETCHAKLRVRDPAVVGQVHACLKCGSMVQLTPPEGWAIGDHALNAAAAASSAEAPLAEPQPAGQPVANQPVANQPVAGPAEPTVTPEQPASPVSASVVSEAEAKLTASLAPARALSPAEGIGRWAATAVAVGAASLAVGIGAAAWWMPPRDSVEPQQLAAAADPNEATPVGFDATDAAADPLAAEPAPDADTPGASPAPTSTEPPLPPLAEPAPVEPPASAAPLPIEQRAAPPVGLPEIDTSQAAADAEPPPQAPALPPLKPPADEPPATPPEPAATASAGPFDPLDFDPASLDLIFTREPPPAPTAEPAAAAETPPGADLDSRLAANARLPAAGLPGAGLPGAGDALDARLDGLAGDARAVVRRGPTGPPNPPADDPLSVVVPEIAVADMPLDRVCRLLSRIAGAPVTLPPEALALAAVGADKPVSVRATGATIGELFEQALEPLRLELLDEGRGLTVARLGGGERRTGKYLVRDLSPGDASPLAELIATVLPSLPATVTAEGERLIIRGAVSAHLRVAVLCERLRKARGLPPRSRYPAELLLSGPTAASAAPTLARRTTFSFVEFTPVDQVFDYWRRASGLVILVDWRALADAGVRPDSTIACSVVDRPWRESLSAVLEGVGLTWRAVGAGVLQITTPAAAADSPRVELRRVANEHAAAALAERLGVLAWAYHPRGGLVALRLP